MGNNFIHDDAWCRRVLSTIPVGQYRRDGKLYSDCFTAAEVIDCLLDNDIVDNVQLAVVMGQELLFKKSLLPVYVDSCEVYERRSNSIDSPRKLMSPRKRDMHEVNADYRTLFTANSSTGNSSDSVSKEPSDNSDSDCYSLDHNAARTLDSAEHQRKKVGFFHQHNVEDSYDTMLDDEPRETSFLSTMSSISMRKLTAVMDTHFMDDNSLYRLNLQSEQVTEWLMVSKKSSAELQALKIHKIDIEKREILVGYSFGVFGPQNTLRKFCTNIVTHSYFENVVLVIIVGSSICLAIDEPGIEQDTVKYIALTVADYFFTIFFVLEMLVKMTSLSLFGAKKSYFSSGWNYLDFAVVVISVVSLALVSTDLSYLKAFRALRSLRPLRMVSRSPSLKAVVNAIIMVITPLANFTLVICVFLFTFAILGTFLFRDKLFYCQATSLDSDSSAVDPDEFRFVYDIDSCIGNVTNADGTIVSLDWGTTNSNFDSVSRALLTLFELITMESWPSIMYPAMDIPSRIGDHPVENNSKYNALFFITFIVVGAFFITNLFVGIIVYKFRIARDDNRGSALLTDAQQKWLDDIQVAMTAEPIRHNSLPSKEALYGYKRPIHLLAMSAPFILTMDVLIIVNILVMATEHFNQGKELARFINITNEVFTAIFTAEIILRFLAVTPKEFLALRWNKIDTVIVIVALIDSAGGSVVFNVTIFRVFRIARLFRLIKDSKDLVVLVKTLYFSLPSLINVGALLFLSFFVFAVVGMNVFANVERDGDLFNSYANFDGFLSSTLILFQCMTGEDWNSIMYILKNQGYDIAVPFFALFLLVNKYMLLNLFIAIILENFEAALKVDTERVAQRNLEDFIHEWSNIRKEIGSNDHDSMPSYCLVKILHCLDPPLGIRGTREANLSLRTEEDRRQYRRYVLNFIRSLDLKEDSSGKVFFVDVVSALVRRGHINESSQRVSVVENMSIDQRHELLSQLSRLTRKRRMAKLEKKMRNKVFTEIDLVVEFNSAMTIQATWRGMMRRRRLKEEMICEDLKKEKDRLPTILLTRGDSEMLRAQLRKHSSSTEDLNDRKSVKLLKLGSDAFGFVRKKAVTFAEKSSHGDENISDGDDENENNYQTDFVSDEEYDIEETSEHISEKKYTPLNIETAEQALDSQTPPKPSKLLSLVRNVSTDFRKTLFQPLSKRYVGGESAASRPGSVRRIASAVDLNEIANSTDDFNYFTVYEDKDERMHLTHVNSKRQIMENLFSGQEKKKQLRRQSTKSVQLELEEEFTDIDVYVMHPETVDPSFLQDDDIEL